MLITDLHAIGDRLLFYRRKCGLTQAEAAEAAGLSDRTYADIERGTVNMRTETVLSICKAFHITPNDIFTEEAGLDHEQEELFARLSMASPPARETALKLIAVYLDSLE
ncbi:MAG: helix-turn-helix transcriptional regulator [Clostridia bacterium]|nr:helix-turn-helix transcriptional regulator [Clostridia bacterium]